MPRRQPAIPAASARLRRPQALLPRLSVPSLLQMPDELGALLDREGIGAGDIHTLPRAATGD